MRGESILLLRDEEVLIAIRVVGVAVLDARLLLDRFSLPARLVCRDGRAQLEAYVGSLAGTPKVAVQAGGRKPVPTGLRLRVDGRGGMAFEPAPARDSSSQATHAPGHAPLAQRLRRRLPSRLDPMMHRLAEVPVLRRAYRRLISR